MTVRSKKKRSNPVAKELGSNQHYRHRIVELRDKDFRLSKKELEKILAEEDDEQRISEDRTVEDSIQQ